MGLARWAEKLFQMSDDVWQRHANPWSVWTRYSCLPLLAIAIWSRVWIGWLSLIPILVVCLWTWLNPRVFKKPPTTNHWASKAVLGERIMLKHPKNEIPAHHNRAITVLNALTFFASFVAVYGLVVLHPWFAIFGILITMIGKTWFLDRMVWLFHDLQDSREEYQAWLY